MKTKIAFAFFALALGITLNSCAKESYVSVNDKVRHDDFLYSVTDFVKSPLISDGTETIKPEGIFYIVHVKIENEAKRVNHKWDNSIAYIVDGTGKEYENNIKAQKLYYKSNFMQHSDEYSLQAGSNASTVFVFDIPKDITDACLKFRGSFLMGDVFDGGKFTKTKVKLY